jgi:hypothetical protein
MPSPVVVPKPSVAQLRRFLRSLGKPLQPSGRPHADVILLYVPDVTASALAGMLQANVEVTHADLGDLTRCMVADVTPLS